MSLNTDAALQILAEDAAPLAEQERLARRVADVRAFMSQDLDDVERQLQDSAERGVRPASDAAGHLLRGGGKRVRPLALLLACRCFGSISAAAKELAVSVELIHSATLLHDDVIDDGSLRRGAPTARTIWGNAVSILTGDLLLVDALQRTQAAAPNLMLPLLDTLRHLVDGEIVQLRGRARLDTSEATYLRILRDKTASLFRFAAHAGAQLGGASPEQQRRLERFGEGLGLAFQLVDDVLDYEGEHTGKTLFADLREGKLTLPLVLACADEPQLVEALARIHAGDDSKVEDVRERVIALGVCDQVRTRARQHTANAVEALAAVPPSGARSLLESVAQQLVSRLR